MRDGHMCWPWVPASERLPEWTDDGAVRVLALTAGDDFDGQQIHDIRAADFYLADHDGPDPAGTEVTRACTHWVYRDDVWPRPASPTGGTHA